MTQARILIDTIELDALRRRQRQEAQAGHDLPVRFPDILETLAPELGPITPAALLRRDAVAMAWHLRPSSVMAALAGRLGVYLCWGVSHHVGWRRSVARYVLRRAGVVLVNDDRTAAEIARIAGITVRRIPYLVDTGFFTYAPPDMRDDFVFCPGANDRNGETLLGLAAKGHRVVWMSNDRHQHARFGGRHPNLMLVIDISYAALRILYCTAAAVVLPLVRDVHAAGQTTTLEAIACGAPVVIDEGRTAELLHDRGCVTSPRDRGVDAWSMAIARAIAANRSTPVAARDAATAIAHSHGPQVFAQTLRPFFRRDHS